MQLQAERDSCGNLFHAENLYTTCKPSGSTTGEAGMHVVIVRSILHTRVCVCMCFCVCVCRCVGACVRVRLCLCVRT